jgi:phytoene desaturase
VEKRDQVGGRTSTLEQDGFKFDIGPTFFLYPKRAARDLRRRRLRSRRRSPHDSPRPAVPAGLRRRGSAEQLRGRAARHSQRRADGTRHRRRSLPKMPCASISFLTRNRTKLEEVPALPAIPLRELARSRQARHDEAAAAARPLAIARLRSAVHFKDERIRLGFSFQSKYLGMSPFRCPSLFSILSFLEYEHGVFHPTGGCGAVTRRWPASPREMGVEILLDEPVEQVLVERGKATGVKTANRSLPADAVVVNADFAGAMRNAWSPTTSAKSGPTSAREEEVLLLHLHDVSRHRRPLRRRLAPHHLSRRELQART